MMETRRFFLFWLAAVTPVGARGIVLSAPRHLDYNRMVMECTGVVQSGILLPLWCGVNGNESFSPLKGGSQPHIPCVNITANNDTLTWNITAVLGSCDRVQLQCGRKRNNKSFELSKPVTLEILQSKKLYSLY